MFRHPKYYKELRKAGNELAKRNAVKENREAYSGSSLARNNSDQVISSEVHDGARERAPGPGPKPRYTPTGILLGVDLGDKPKASSSKRQASSNKLTKSQASSGKHQAPSTKAQA